MTCVGCYLLGKYRMMIANSYLPAYVSGTLLQRRTHQEISGAEQMQPGCCRFGNRPLRIVGNKTSRCVGYSSMTMCFRTKYCQLFQYFQTHTSPFEATSSCNGLRQHDTRRK